MGAKCLRGHSGIGHFGIDSGFGFRASYSALDLISYFPYRDIEIPPRVGLSLSRGGGSDIICRSPPESQRLL
jgi:hypothetical protein